MPHYSILITTGQRGRDTQVLRRTGTYWNKPYCNTAAVQLTSDGNGVTATVYHSYIEGDETVIRLDYAEAEELGIALIEYTKSDPHAPIPLYEVKETRLQKKKRKK